MQVKLIDKLDCEQSFFCSEIHREEGKTSECASVTESVTSSPTLMLIAVLGFICHTRTLVLHSSLLSSPRNFEQKRDHLQSVEKLEHW